MQSPHVLANSGSVLQPKQVQAFAEESRAQGNIATGLYVKYLRAGANMAVVVVAILLNILAQVSSAHVGFGLKEHVRNVCLPSFRWRTSCRTGGWPTGRCHTILSSHPTGGRALICCLCPRPLIRANEQHKLTTNVSVSNISRELDTDFYLGVYGGTVDLDTSSPPGRV